MAGRDKLRYAVKNLYKNLVFMGKDYPLGATYFRDKCHNAFMKNRNIEDPKEIEMLIKRGEYIMKELEAMYMLRKYRSLRQKYYKDEPHHETILKGGNKN